MNIKILFLIAWMLTCVFCADHSIYASDSDVDQDGIIDLEDNCPDLANADQSDADHDGYGDVCDEDDDDDEILDSEDNCPLRYNHDQYDDDGDGIGDLCDDTPFGARDADDDGIPDVFDPCPQTPNFREDADSDGDSVPDHCDNCPSTPNVGQVDRDADRLGDACEDVSSSIVELTLERLRALMADGQLSCEDVVSAHLQRAWEFDADVSQAAMINSITEFNAAALARARELDMMYADSGPVGPLHCVPMVLKSNYRNTELAATYGSFALDNAVGKYDAHTVDELRKSGAVLLGTTTMDEFARGVTGVSGRGGRAGNAYDPYREAGGSSSGSASAVSASFAMLGTGTDNCASLTLPAAYQGIVTLRSTQGLVSTEGIYPSGPQDAVAGPMTRTVADLAVAMNVMATPDPGAPYHHADRAAERPDYTEHLDPEGLAGKRLGILRELAEDTTESRRRPYEGASSEVQLTFEKALRRMEAAGATLVDNVTLPSFDEGRTGGGLIFEFLDWLVSTEGPQTLVEFCESDGFSPFIYASAEECISRAKASFERRSTIEAGFKRYNENLEHIESVMDRLDLDALILPVGPVGWAQTSYRATNCVVYSTSRLPTITWPVAQSDSPSLPVGMMAVGRAWDEATLFEIAYGYEATYGVRFAPDLPESRGVPPFDVEVFNQAKRDVARTAFEDVLVETGSKGALDAKTFRNIALERYRDAGYTWWLPE